jgi:preprotein translocase subunit SecE
LERRFFDGGVVLLWLAAARKGGVPVGTFFSELIRFGVYKRSQGRIARQVTFAAVVGAVALGLMRLSTLISAVEWKIGVPAVLLAAAVWTTYRLVNVPAVADFLIAVEAEMNKVSWPSRSELIRASTVVLVMMLALAVILAGYDIFWKLLLSRGLGIL